jgi:hypothetical protein
VQKDFQERKEIMIRKKKGKLTFLLSPNLSQSTKLIHAISTRNGGVSSGSYKSLNLSFHVEDEQENVIHNYRILSRALGFNLRSLITCQQIHHNTVALVDKSYFKKDCFLPQNAIPETDALVTDVPGITLMTRYADCVPLFFYDPKTNTIAIAHAGWKGTLSHIVRKTVEVLVNEYHCKPENILTAIGPSIGPCCFQIGSTMADEAVKELSGQEYLKEGSDGSIYFNLWKANEKQLKDTGIKDDHLHCAGLCTACNTDLFFSYRREKRVTGRFGALIGLREERHAHAE